MLRALFVLLSLWLCLGFLVQAEQSASVSSPDFKATVGATPLAQWTFSQDDNSSYVYKVTLISMWETENGTDSYDFVDGSVWYPLGWTNATLGKIVNNTQQISFATTSGMNPGHFDSLAFNTQIPMWHHVNTSDYPAGKFDVEISNYEWTSTSDTAQLTLAFVVDYEVDSASPKMPYNITTHGSRTIDFGGAYISINSTAMGGPATNVSSDVTIKMASALNLNTLQKALQTSLYNTIDSNHVAYVIYDHFDTNLKHDPEFGFGIGPGNSYIWIIIIVVVVIAIIVIILIAVIGFILVRRRRRSYDAF